MSVLEMLRVSAHYPQRAEAAISDVTLTVRAGELCVLAGLTGAGKSTLLRAAAGLFPHFDGGTLTGRVTVAGRDTREHSPARLSAHVGTVFQDPERQVVMGTVEAEIAFALENHGHAAGAVARGVEEVALALGIAPLLRRRTDELSGGELQRVALAAALAPRPRLLLLDEPTSQLDPVAGDELIWQLRRLNEEWGTAIVIAEHRIERCLAAADRVIAMHAGRLACDADPRTFLYWAADALPALLTPAAELFARAGLDPPPAGVKQARAALRARGLLTDEWVEPSSRPAGRRAPRSPHHPALRLKGVWHELRDGPAILRGVDLELRRGEVVALMGRNGAGKTTLLRHAAGRVEPTRGRVTTAGAVALLSQCPDDHFLHERVADETSAAALARAGLTGHAQDDPRDLSGGERQLLALAIVADGAPALLCVDEPTRGLDRAAKQRLAEELQAHAAGGAAILVATHDVEFAAALCGRVVLLADGRVIADAPTVEVLTGGFYFATETARILAGVGPALRPSDGARLLVDRLEQESREVTPA